MALKDFKPALILACITAAVTMLLVVMQSMTQTEEEGLSGRLRELCFEIIGEGDYTVQADVAGLSPSVKKVITHDESGTVAFQIVVKGYNRDGLDMLVVMNSDGSVNDLEIIRNTETPGIGTRVEDRAFLESFIGLSENTRIVKAAPKSDHEIAAITGATKSARGVSDAVNVAIEAYKELFGE